jgi:CelD/BcsL family acetyltransferase involved in cellulose biosynthesis
LEGEGPAGMEVVRSDADLDRDLADALRLESSAWKGAHGTAIDSRADSKAFYESLLRTAAKEGWLRLYFLTTAGRRIAVRIALLFHHRLYMLKSGYDPEYARFSPSHLLCYKMLREAWNERHAEVDFLGQAERWKLSWSNGLRPHVYLFLFPRRPIPRLLHAMKFQLLPRLRRTGVYERLRRSAAKLGITMYEE